VAQSEGNRMLDVPRSVSTRWHEWRSRRRVLKSQRLLHTASGARMLGATLTTLESDLDTPERPQRRRQLRFW
jgi:hypothetical protein